MGKTYDLTINDILEDATPADLRFAIDNVLESNVILSSDGALADFKKAILLGRVTTDFVFNQEVD